MFMRLICLIGVFVFGVFIGGVFFSQKPSEISEHSQVAATKSLGQPSLEERVFNVSEKTPSKKVSVNLDEPDEGRNWGEMTSDQIRFEFAELVKRNVSEDQLNRGKIPKVVRDALSQVFELDVYLGIEVAKESLATEDNFVSAVDWQQAQYAAQHSLDAFVKTMELTVKKSALKGWGTFAISYPEAFDFRGAIEALEKMRAETPEVGGFHAYPENLFESWAKREPENALYWLEQNKPEKKRGSRQDYLPSLEQFFSAQQSNRETGVFLGNLWNEQAFEQKDLLNALSSSLKEDGGELFLEGFVSEISNSQ